MTTITGSLIIAVVYLLFRYIFLKIAVKDLNTEFSVFRDRYFEHIRELDELKNKFESFKAKHNKGFMKSLIKKVIEDKND